MADNFGKKHTNDLCDWFLTPLGDNLLGMELAAISNLPVKLFGHYILQLGGRNDLDLLTGISIQKQIYVNPDLKFLPAQCNYNICADYGELPFLPNSIDCAVIFHVLEFAQQPRQILREIFSSIVPEGYAVIFGFNPFSLLGLLHYLSSKKKLPLSGNYISSSKLQHWLLELGFSVISKKTLFFRPPFSKRKELHKFLFMEGLGQLFWPSFGNVYMLLVKKQTLITPAKKKVLQHLVPLTANSYVKPTSRLQN